MISLPIFELSPAPSCPICPVCYECTKKMSSKKRQWIHGYCHSTGLFWIELSRPMTVAGLIIFRLPCPIRGFLITALRQNHFNVGSFHRVSEKPFEKLFVFFNLPTRLSNNGLIIGMLLRWLSNESGVKKTLCYVICTNRCNIFVTYSKVK